MLPPAALPSPAVLTPSSVPPPALPATSPSQWLVCKLACSVIVRCHLSSSGTSSLQPARAALCRAFSPSRSCSSLLDVNFSLEFSYFFFASANQGMSQHSRCTAWLSRASLSPAVRRRRVKSEEETEIMQKQDLQRGTGAMTQQQTCNLPTKVHIFQPHSSHIPARRRPPPPT